jgi:hypothetical protein
LNFIILILEIDSDEVIDTKDTTLGSTTSKPDKIIYFKKDEGNSWTYIIITIFVVAISLFVIIIGGLYAVSLFSMWI